MSNQLVQFSVVVRAESNNPTILNPDFLKIQKIVPSEWEVASPPITTPPFAIVQYKSGVSISVRPDVLQVTDDESKEPNDSKISQIVNRYVEVVPHVQYTAVGINFLSSYIAPAGFNLKTHFLKDGPWDLGNNQLENVGLKFTYTLDKERLLLSLDANIQEGKSDIIIKANFHREVNAKDSQLSQIADCLENIPSYWDHYNNLLSDILPEEHR